MRQTFVEANVSEAAFNAGVAYLTERPSKGFTSNADFSHVFANGKRHDVNNQACHGSMRGEDRELIASVSCWSTYRYKAYVDSYANKPYKGVLATAIGERFYDWFVNRSWAADYIIAPDQGFATYSGIMVSTDIPANYLLAIMTMSRNAQEQAHNVHRMYDYVDEFGISEDLAYFLAFGVATDNKYGTIVSGHNLFYQQGAKALDNWMKRSIQHTSDIARTGGYNSGVNLMWGGREEDICGSFERFKNVVEAGSVVIPNPFKPVVKRNVITEEFLRDIIPNIAKEYENREQDRIAA